jgi:hypothetical protein
VATGKRPPRPPERRREDGTYRVAQTYESKLFFFPEISLPPHADSGQAAANTRGAVIAQSNWHNKLGAARKDCP